MLKTSPTIATCGNASPATVCGAQMHGHRPQQSALPTSTRLQRSRSMTQATAGVDSSLGTQDNVAEKIHPLSHKRDAVLRPASRSPADQQNKLPPSPSPEPGPGSESSTIAVSKRSSLRSGNTNVSSNRASGDPPLSPNKRRSSSTSRGVNADNESATSTDKVSPASATSRQPRPDERLPKILPQRYELCAVEDMVELIAHMLAELIATNDALQISSGGLTRFHSRTAPGISVRDYLQRLAKHATFTPPLLLAMVYYIDRLCALYPQFTINTLTVHRFLITAVTVAAKGLSDSFWNNTTYARVGGVPVAELKLLELEFLHRVDWKIVPNPEVLVAYYRGLVERTPNYTLGQDGPGGMGAEATLAQSDV